jgi:proline dehydrogenase
MRFPPTRKVARRFVAGETLDDALAVTRALRAEGFLVSLDLLGENVDGLGEATAATQEVLRSVEALKSAGLVSNISVKLTQLGLDESVEVARANLRSIAEATAGSGMVVRVDMEGSAYTEVTISMVSELHREFPHLATVLQSYLLRTIDDVGRLNREGVAVRICKGAYAEPPEIAFQEKAAVDEAYLRAAEELLSHGNYPAIATHDEKMIQGVLEIVRRLGLGPDQFEFQMLYGIRQDRQRQLLQDGWRVRLYLPYGCSWYPYFMRRLAERPANLWFLLTALLRG